MVPVQLEMEKRSCFLKMAENDAFLSLLPVFDLVGRSLG
jgi:hypothetical protein